MFKPEKTGVQLLSLFIISILVLEDMHLFILITLFLEELTHLFFMYESISLYSPPIPVNTPPPYMTLSFLILSTEIKKDCRCHRGFGSIWWSLAGSAACKWQKTMVHLWTSIPGKKLCLPNLAWVLPARAGWLSRTSVMWRSWSVAGLEASSNLHWVIFTTSPTD